MILAFHAQIIVIHKILWVGEFLIWMAIVRKKYIFAAGNLFSLCSPDPNGCGEWCSTGSFTYNHS